MSWPWIDEAMERAKAAVADSPWTWRFEHNGMLVEAHARGVSADHHFSDQTGPILVRSADDPALVQALDALLTRMAATADRFHRATPWPIFLKSQREAMTYRQLVDAALDQYHGAGLTGLSLGPQDWVGFLVETELRPDASGQVTWRDVPITLEAKGLRYIFAAPAPGDRRNPSLFAVREA